MYENTIYGHRSSTIMVPIDLQADFLLVFYRQKLAKHNPREEQEQERNEASYMTITR